MRKRFWKKSCPRERKVKILTGYRRIHTQKQTKTNILSAHISVIRFVIIFENILLCGGIFHLSGKIKTWQRGIPEFKCSSKTKVSSMWNTYTVQGVHRSH